MVCGDADVLPAVHGTLSMQNAATTKGHFALATSFVFVIYFIANKDAYFSVCKKN